MPGHPRRGLSSHADTAVIGPAGRHEERAGVSRRAAPGTLSARPGDPIGTGPASGPGGARPVLRLVAVRIDPALLHPGHGPARATGRRRHQADARPHAGDDGRAGDPAHLACWRGAGSGLVDRPRRVRAEVVRRIRLGQVQRGHQTRPGRHRAVAGRPDDGASDAGRPGDVDRSPGSIGVRHDRHVSGRPRCRRLARRSTGPAPQEPAACGAARPRSTCLRSNCAGINVISCWKVLHGKGAHATAWHSSAPASRDAFAAARRSPGRPAPGTRPAAHRG